MSAPRAGSSRGWTARAGAPRCLWELDRPPRMPPALNSAQCKEMTARTFGDLPTLGSIPAEIRARVTSRDPSRAGVGGTLLAAPGVPVPPGQPCPSPPAPVTCRRSAQEGRRCHRACPLPASGCALISVRAGGNRVIFLPSLRGHSLERAYLALCHTGLMWKSIYSYVSFSVSTCAYIGLRVHRCKPSCEFRVTFRA